MFSTSSSVATVFAFFLYFFVFFFFNIFFVFFFNIFFIFFFFLFFDAQVASFFLVLCLAIAESGPPHSDQGFKWHEVEK